MNRKSLHLMVALSLVGGASYAAKERVVRFQNHVRVGYDDNIYATKDGDGSAFVTDIVNLSAKLNFSTRTDALLYWQPEFQYRVDGDPELITYQDLYARLNHAISQQAFLTLSDRFRYQQKEGQVDDVDDFNQNYIENDLLGALEYTLNPVSYVKVGAGYEFRVWDDSDYGKWDSDNNTGGNDYTQLKGDASYIRQLKPNKTQAIGGVNVLSHSYDGDRGGYDSFTFMGGVDQNFTANMTGFGRLGYTFASIDGVDGASEDSSSPYLEMGMDYNPSARTTFNGTFGYSVYRSQNSSYNMQDRLSFGLGARHDITAKINIAATMSYIISMYDAKYTSGVNSVSDFDDSFLSLTARCSYQVNRNNFVEAGYYFGKRMSDASSAEYDRNRFDVGWRLRL
ncbi:outer membrane beta-barrel protein [Pontiella sp.]|uniref:outer membrane beta-barrel protein n=1 Tax=Pontiella sp. TaxID=2837462 RepID=UPI00356AD97D